MTNIKNIGRFCMNDSKGYILNDARPEKVDFIYNDLIKTVVETYKYQLQSDLHSVYIRGSIPRGLGIPGVSDLDTLCVTNKELKEIDLIGPKKQNEKLTKISLTLME